ncbi:unnamed protein product [Closterium sp. NIES-53]
MNRKKLRQIDAANAFLYAPVDAESFVELPHGSNAGPNQICQLEKSLYEINETSLLCFTSFLPYSNMESEQVDPHGSILCMGPPNASAAVMLIARLRRASPVCLPRAHGARHFFLPAALQATRRPALPCPSCAPRRTTVFCHRRTRHPGGPRFAPPPVARRGDLGGRASPTPPSPVEATWGPRVAPPPSPVEATWGGACRPLPFFVAALPCPAAALSRPYPALPLSPGLSCPGPVAALPPPTLPTRQLRPCPVLGFGGGEYGVAGVCGLPFSSSSFSHCCSCR